MAGSREGQFPHGPVQLQGQNHPAMSHLGGMIPGNQLVSVRKTPPTLHGFILEPVTEKKKKSGLEVSWDGPPAITRLPFQEDLESEVKKYKENCKKIRTSVIKEYEKLGNGNRRRWIDRLINDETRLDSQQPRAHYELAALKLEHKSVHSFSNEQITVSMRVILKRRIKDDFATGPERNQVYLVATDQQFRQQGQNFQQYPNMLPPHAPSQMPHPAQPQQIPHGHGPPVPPPHPPQGPSGPPMNHGPGAGPPNQPPPPPPGPGPQQRPPADHREPQRGKSEKQSKPNSSKKDKRDIRPVQSRDRGEEYSSDEEDRFLHSDDDDGNYHAHGFDERYERHDPRRSASGLRRGMSQENLRRTRKSPARRFSMSKGPNGRADGPESSSRSLIRRDSFDQDHRKNPRQSATHLPRESSDRIVQAPEPPKAPIVNINIGGNDRKKRGHRNQSDNGTAIDDLPYHVPAYSSGSDLDFDDAGSSTFSAQGGSDFTNISPSSSGSFPGDQHHGHRRGRLHKPTDDRPRIHQAYREHTKPLSYPTPSHRDHQRSLKYSDNVDDFPAVTYISKRRNRSYHPALSRPEYRRSLTYDYEPEMARDAQGYSQYARPLRRGYASRGYEAHDWHDDYPEAIFEHEENRMRPVRWQQRSRRTPDYADYSEERSWEYQ